MTTEAQKELEISLAKKAADLLKEFWVIEPAIDEIDWPDLIIKSKHDTFGLEVREVFKDEKRKGSTLHSDEKTNLRKVSALSIKYYQQSNTPIYVKVIGDLNVDLLLRVLIENANTINIGGTKRIKENRTVIYIKRLPSYFGKYDRWIYVTDRVGWVRKIDKEFLEAKIEEKSKKLTKYRRNLADVRLLLVADAHLNSGKIKLDGYKNINCFGFDQIYFISELNNIVRLKKEKGQVNCI